MRRFILSATVALFFVSVTAQVQVKPMPKSGYEQRIRNYVNNMKIVDTHEHLVDPAEFTDSMLDFTLLLRHYSGVDFYSAGMSGKDIDLLFGDSLSVIDKWKLLEPYWDLSFNTGFNRVAQLSASKLFGVEDINAQTVGVLSERLKKAYQQPDWYDQVLKEKCNIEFVIEDWSFDWDNRFKADPGMYKYIRRLDPFIFIRSSVQIKELGKWNPGGIRTVDDLVSAMKAALDSAVKDGVIAVKSWMAYRRTLVYDKVRKEEADYAFSKVMNAPADQPVPFEEIKPLQDYMMFRMLDLARANHLPVEIHTGLNGGIIEDANPTHLTNLFMEYPDVNFILFHGSYPYLGQLSNVAKFFPNVYIDMCWVYIISPSYAERALQEWLETVPAGKIMAFGGDFLYVEDVYGHMLMARETVANVLVDKVKSAYFSEDEAIRIARMLLHDNAVRIFGLKK